MRVTRLLVALSLLPASFLSIAATDGESCTELDTDIVGCEQTLWLGGCDQAAGGKVYHQVLHGSVPLTDVAPDASFTAGAGCGTYEEPAFRGGGMENPFYDLSINGYGEFQNPGTVTVELHDIYASAGRATGELLLDVRLTVDGLSLFGYEEITLIDDSVTTTPTILRIPVTPVVSETGISEKLEFTVVGLYEAFPELFFVDGEGDGYTDVVASISIVDDGGHVFVWGAQEIPANIRFNAEPAGTIVEAGTGQIVPQP